jgi:hypothetical protein
MRRRTDPRQIAKVVEVQRARRAGAEVALGAARDAEALARIDEEAAVEKVSAAQDDWLAFLDEPGFAPDYARALAARLVARESVATDAQETRQAAAIEHARREQDWRLAQANMKLTEAGLTRARRDAARDREERRLGALSDRVTYAWVRA